MVNEDVKEFSFGNLLNHSILQNLREINIRFHFPWMEKHKTSFSQIQG